MPRPWRYLTEDQRRTEREDAEDAAAEYAAETCRPPVPLRRVFDDDLDDLLCPSCGTRLCHGGSFCGGGDAA